MTSNQQLATSNQTLGFRFSPLQKHLWLQQQGNNLPYNALAMIRLEGEVDFAILEAAVADVVNRHEILRTTFQRLPGMALPVQVISDRRVKIVRRADLSQLPAAQHASAVAAFFQEGKNSAFDFENGPLIQLSYTKLSSTQHLMLVALPALCADAVSLENFVREVARAYAAPRRHEEYRDGVMQYADIAEWQNELLEAAEGEPGRAFWRQQDFKNWLHAPLPFEKYAGEDSSFKPLEVVLTLPVDLSAKIIAVSQRLKTSPANFLLACYQTLCWRLTGEENVLIGVNDSGRKYEELQAALGLFAKYLPVTGRLNAKARFTEVLASTHATVEKVNAWQEFFAWEKMNGTTAPFFPLCFDYADTPAIFSADEVTFAIQQKYVCTDRFKIKLACARNNGSLHLSFHYDANHFHAEAIQRFAEQFQALLESAMERPEAPVCELNILSPAERQYLLYDFNNTQAAYPAEQCIHHVIEAQARRTPDRVAVIFEEQVLTYGELNARANQLAHYLRARGVGPDVLVGICVERSLEMIIGMLGILKAGGAYLPLDPAYPPERLHLMLEDTQAPVLLTKQLTIDNYQLAMVNSRLQVIRLDTDWDAIAQESRDHPVTEVIPENLVYIIYTSGSTGKPKGVVISHQDLIISNGARIAYFKQPVHKFLLLSSLSFDSSVVGIFWTLCEGGALFLVPEDVQQNVPELAKIIEQNQISHLLTLPSFYALILEYAQPRQLQCLRTAIVAGEACPQKMVDQHIDTLKQTALFSEYGATETTVFSSVYDCLEQTLNLAPVGDPIANAQMYVLDAWQQPQPVGVPGEVYFGGDALSKGYWRRPDLTAEKFIPHPFSLQPGARLYKSGDLARHLPNGDIEFLGRIDNQVKIRGFRIELEEIEAVLSQHPAVREVVVDAREVTAGSKRLVAYLAAAKDASASIGAWRHFLSERLPDYMVPSAFVVMESLPKNPNGKIDRRALPDPGPERPDLEETFVAAQSTVEKKLAEIWATVLRLEKVGVHDNFFELGGDSILSIQIISKAKQAGLHITPLQIFQHQTIAELAQVAGAQRITNAEQGFVSGDLPLTPIQCWFFEKELPHPDHWNVSLLLEVQREIPLALLQQAAQHLLNHHDALRIRFSNDAGWRQTVLGMAQNAPVDHVDISSWKEDQQIVALEEKTAEFQAKLNLARGPLMRFVLFERGAGRRPYLLWVLHHLVCDVVSWRIMIEDLQSALEQLERGGVVQLPAKTTSFKHWAERLAAHAQSETVKSELEYWRTALAAPLPALPLDYQNDLAANTEASTRALKVFLTPEETRALLQEVPKAYNTQINEALVTALAQSFCQWTGGSSVLIDLEGHGREEIFAEVDLSRTVGWFTIFYPVLLKVAGADPGEAISAIKEQLRRIPKRGLGYSLLRYLHREAALAALPQAQINFNYLGQFDQVLQDSARFHLVQETNIYDRSPAGMRSHVLEIVGSVIRGSLQVEWFYSANLHRAATIEVLAQNFIRNLRALIQHGQAPGAKNFTPSDFTDFSWDQNDLENIAAAIQKAQGEN
ncbi:amino acid adenylation domain-containing protein [candidate division KSB1 bacterium]|nr:amino acid adenylation domain-containing protein [candidate division KSB1 bacterium]